MKFSILFPYINRPGQLHNTLISFSNLYSGRNDYEIIIIEDDKNKNCFIFHKDLQQVIDSFKMLPIKLINQIGGETYNPTLHYNQGANSAVGKYLILTSPECFHTVDILSGLKKEFDENENRYVICSCIGGTNSPLFISDFDKFTYKKYMWYQHTKERPADYNFCSAITKQNFLNINGFDLTYKDGIAFDDDVFRDKIRNSDLEIVRRDDLVVIHQQHAKLDKVIGREEYSKRWHINRNLYGSNGNG